MTEQQKINLIMENLQEAMTKIAQAMIELEKENKHPVPTILASTYKP